MTTEFLEATRWINYTDPRVKDTAAELVALAVAPKEKLQAIAGFVRERIRLEVNAGSRLATASEVLSLGTGTATGKAVLLAALCRATGLPCRICLQRLSGAPDRWTALGRLAKLEWEEAHPMNEVLIDGRWIAVDVSLDSEAASRLGLRMPYITGERDSTLGEAISWIDDLMLSVCGSPHSGDNGKEGIPLELLRLAATTFRG